MEIVRQMTSNLHSGEPLPQQFVGPVHCAEPSNDGLIYVCDRGADESKFFDRWDLRKAQIAAETVGAGAAWDVFLRMISKNLSMSLMVLT